MLSHSLECRKMSLGLGSLVWVTEPSIISPQTRWQMDLLWSVFTLWNVFSVIKRVIFDENQGQEVRDSRKSLAEPSWAVSSAPYSLPRRQPQPEGWDSVIERFCREAPPLRTQGSSHGAHPQRADPSKGAGKKGCT